MTFADVVSYVMGITKRPDKQAETERAVNAALSYFCLKEKFDKDIIESSITINNSLYGDTISLASLTRFREFKYIKVPGKLSYLKRMDSTQIFSPGGIMQKNCFYTAGTNLTYILSTLAPSLEVAYYTYPAVLSGVQTHWMLEISPYCVIDKAAAEIFKTIGDDASFKIHEGFARDRYDVLVRDLA